MARARTGSTTTGRRLLLVADIGGTNARFALADPETLLLTRFEAFPCAEFASLQAAITVYLGGIEERPSCASFAIAGPIVAGTVRMTNLPWTITHDTIREACCVEDVCIVNDFEALALSLPLLGGEDLHQIGGTIPIEHSAKAVLGPGTGLGVGGAIWSPSGWRPVSGEGGHVSFGAQTRDEFAILDQLRKDHGHLSMERLLSGPGLSVLYAVLAGQSGEEADRLPVAEVVARALAHSDRAAEVALGWFSTWLGRFAGDLALVLGARGGVYLGGGIPPRIVNALAAGRFRESFEAKGRLSDYLGTIPVYVILARDAGLLGAVLAFRAHYP